MRKTGATGLGSSLRRRISSTLRASDPRALRDWLASQLAIESDARTAFHALPLGLMLGIAIVHGWHWRPLSLAWLGAALALCAGSRLISAHSLRLLLAGLGCVLFGGFVAGRELSRNDTVIFSGESTVRIGARVLWRDRDERGRLRYLVEIRHTERPVLSRAPRRAAILVSSGHPPIPIGGSYEGLVRLRPPSGPALPGGYDFAFGAFFKGLGAYGFALGPPDDPGPDASTPLTAAERLVRLRLRISDRIREAIGGGEGAVASAIVTGERTGIPDDVDAWLRATGLSHVLSISGLHMALVAGFAMTLLRLVFAAVPPLALNLPAKKIAAVAALATAAFYLALSGFDVATTRSFIMIAIMLVAVVLDRSALTLRNVSIAALIVLTVTPHALMTASFQMSFGATSAIVAAYGATARWRGERDHGRPGRALPATLGLWLLGIGASSLLAGLATSPFAAFHFQRIAPYGLIANMLALPIFSFWIMPLALIAMILMPIGLDGLPLWLIGKGLTVVFEISRFLYERLPDDPTGLVGQGAFLMLALALLAACFLASRLRLVALPIAAAGLVLLSQRPEPPELLVFEDGRELATIDPSGQMSPLKARPNRFVMDQWLRAYPPPAGIRAPANGFTCEEVEETEDVPEAPSKTNGERRRYCRAVLRSGTRVVWTDSYRETGRACDEADIAIVARAIRLESCRSGAWLTNARTLRRTGSLSVGRAPDGSIEIGSAIGDPIEEWNRHRLAPWPEAWRRPASETEETSR